MHDLDKDMKGLFVEKKKDKLFSKFISKNALYMSKPFQSLLIEKQESAAVGPKCLVEKVNRCSSAQAGRHILQGTN